MPLFEMPVEAVEQPVPPPVAAPEPLKPLEINFHNRAAVQTGLITALAGWIMIWLLSWLPVPKELLPLITLLAAGFLAVWLYRRRTGESLSVLSGARLGWITGIFSFAIVTVLFTFVVLVITNREGFTEFYKEQLKSSGVNEIELNRMLQIVQNPSDLITLILLSLAMMFILFTVFPTLGGAIGAKLLARDRA